MADGLRHFKHPINLEIDMQIESSRRRLLGKEKGGDQTSKWGSPYFTPNPQERQGPREAAHQTPQQQLFTVFHGLKAGPAVRPMDLCGVECLG